MNDHPVSDRHSSLYLNDERDFWWNIDYCQLLVHRWGAGSVRNVLDVGCGLGHWTKTLAAVLHPDTRFTGVDRDPGWVNEAAHSAVKWGLGSRFEFREAQVESLPFDDHTFDMVTCQTLLMHVPDVRHALSEMIRVAKPGGLIVLCEPSNRANQMVTNTVLDALPLDRQVERMQFYMTCHHGKMLLGEGDNAIGDLLPNYLVKLPVHSIDISVNDKATALYPPYESREQDVLVREVTSGAVSDSWVWSMTDTRRFFIAGGGNEQDFVSQWKLRIEEQLQVVPAIEENWFSTGGGSILYVIACRTS